MARLAECDNSPVIVLVYVVGIAWAIGIAHRTRQFLHLGDVSGF